MKFSNHVPTVMSHWKGAHAQKGFGVSHAYVTTYDQSDQLELLGLRYTLIISPVLIVQLVKNTFTLNAVPV